MELTVENAYQLLDSTEYTEEYLKGSHPNPHFQHHDWIDTIKLMLDSFWPGNRINHCPLERQHVHGSRIFLDKKYENIVFEDVTNVAFTSYYPTLIYQLNNIEEEYNNFNKDWKDIDPYDEEDWGENLNVRRKLKWNSDKFPILFNFLFENRKKLNDMNNEKIKILLRILLNYTFGAANNPYSIIKCDMNNMTEVARGILIEIENKFPNHVIYQDTDETFFSAFGEIKEDFMKYMEELDLTCEIKNYKYFIPSRIKRYICSDSELKIRGYKRVNNLRIYNEKIEEGRRRI